MAGEQLTIRPCHEERNILSLSSDPCVHLILSDAVMVNNTVTNLKSRKEGNPYQEISDTRQL